MQKLFSTIMLLAFYCSVFGQTPSIFQIGLSAGANQTYFDVEDDNTSRIGFYAGAWTRVGLPFVYLQPELYVARKNLNLKTTRGLVSPLGTTGTTTYANTTSSKEGKNKIGVTSIDIPVLLGTRFVNSDVGFRFSAGPVFSFIVDQDQDFYGAALEHFKGSFKDQIRSWQFGFGIDATEKIGVDLKYDKAAKHIWKDDYNKSTWSLLMLGLTYRIR